MFPLVSIPMWFGSFWSWPPLLNVSSSIPTLRADPPGIRFRLRPPPAVFDTVWIANTMPSAPAPSLSPMPTGLARIWNRKSVEKEAFEAGENVFVRKALDPGAEEAVGQAEHALRIRIEGPLEAPFNVKLDACCRSQ